jgi:type I restriction enzyme R subunit
MHACHDPVCPKEEKKLAQIIVRDFERYVEESLGRIEALTVFCSQSVHRHEVAIKQMMEKLRSDRPELPPLRVWQAYARLDEYRGRVPTSELAGFISILRHACRISGDEGWYSIV